MASLLPDSPRLQYLYAQLERSLIDDYLRGRGQDPDKLRDRDDVEAHLLLAEASTYAAAKLTEVESRAHYVHEMHAGGGTPRGGSRTR
jgi:hypothetical protein